MRGERLGREEIIAAIRQAAAELGANTIAKRRFAALTGITDHFVLLHFGSWSRAVAAAGLQPGRRGPLPDEMLFRNLADTLGRTDGTLTLKEFCRTTKIPKHVYRDRFGG